MVRPQSPAAAFSGEHVEEGVVPDGSRPASFDIPPAMGYKHHERLGDDFFPGEEEGSNVAVRIHLRKQLGCTGCMP